jgi:hypothetical protein
MLFKTSILGLIASICLLGCSGNNDNTKTTQGVGLKRFAGVVNNASVYGVNVAAIPISSHGQYRLNSDGDVDSVVKDTNEEGRYSMTVGEANISPYVLVVTTPSEKDIEDDNAELTAKVSCQVVSGCLVVGAGSKAFGEQFLLPAGLVLSAAIESVFEGQFVVINPVTEMASVLGYTEYIDDYASETETVGSQAAPSYYSSLGIIKGNSQTANLLGLKDILSIEPVNLFTLHDLVKISSTTIQESIRYGALIAAWQQLEQEYNGSLVAGEASFQREVVAQYISNQGQMYQAAPSNGDVLSLKDWYAAAMANLIAARNYHKALARTVPSEVELVIARFEDEIQSFKDGVPTAAEPTIPPDLTAGYFEAVTKTKAMVEYVSDLTNNFSTAEYRASYSESSSEIRAKIDRIVPKFDVMLSQLLDIYDYYLTCVYSVCSTESEWKSISQYNASSKVLTITQSEHTRLEISQSMVFDSINPEGSESTNVHDLIVRGAIEYEGLRFELSNIESEQSDVIYSSLRFSFAKALAELPLAPALIEGGKGATVDGDLVPDGIELVLPDFKLYEPALVGTDDELIVSGVFSALMAASVDPRDLLEGTEDTDKLGKRYNLSNVSMTVKIIGHKQGELDPEAENTIELRDNAVISLNAVASEAIYSSNNTAVYFPDSIYPSLDSFFKPRQGFEVGKVSSAPLAISRRGMMEFPDLTSEGFSEDSENVVLVQYLEIDYEIGGLERYVVYPKLDGNDKYWGLMCTNIAGGEEDLDALVAAGDLGYTRTVKNSEGNDEIQSLLTCEFGALYEGEATPDALINAIYGINKSQVNLREINGQGVYRISYPTIDDGEGLMVLAPFPQVESEHYGVIEQTIVLGVDSMRLQYQPELVNDAKNAYLPETVLDVSLVWRTHELIDVNMFFAFDAQSRYANPNGSGLPYIAIGDNSESYSIAYRTNSDGSEEGQFTFFWSGVTYVDGPVENSLALQKTTDEELKEDVAVEIGSNVFYKQSNSSVAVSEENCGFLSRGQRTDEGIECDAIAYLTYRGLVTGSIREERDGVYVVRYIDDTWQVLGN